MILAPDKGGGGGGDWHGLLDICLSLLTFICLLPCLNKRRKGSFYLPFFLTTDVQCDISGPVY